MKHFRILFLAISIACLSALPATANSSNESAMLFPQFENGFAVLRSNNARIPAQFNYDVVAERMLFYNAYGELLEMEANGVVMVRVGERTFIPSGRLFYERIAVGDHAFYVRHRIQPFTRTAATGGSTYTNIRHTVGDGGVVLEDANSRTQAVGVQFSGTTVSTAGMGSIMGVAQTHSYRELSSVFVRDGRRFVQISSLRRLTNLFRPHQARIEAFANENETNFSNVEDVRAIVAYALSL